MYLLVIQGENVFNRISINTRFQPSIRDSDIAVWDVLRWLGQGLTEADILERNPCLEQEDFRVVYTYAAFVGENSAIADRMRNIRAALMAKLELLK